MSRAVLLDVNILIALMDPSHIHHIVAHDWFADNRGRGWATSPITENGLVRVLSNPKYGGNSDRPAGIAGRLAAMCSTDDHLTWPDSVSLRDTGLFNLSALSHRAIGDVYLLGLAHTNHGVFATFDRNVPVNAVIGATRDTLEVIGG